MMFMGLMATIGVTVSLNAPIAQSYFSAMLATTIYGFDDEPSTIEEALKRPDGAQWWNATMEE